MDSVVDRPALRAYTKVVAACTFMLLLAGGMVTSTGSGLAVPDWPLSFGRVMPEMRGGVLYEHGHRMIATFVGALIVVEALWLGRSEPRGRVRALGWLALAGVVLQGLLGGLTVLLRLPDAVSVSHAGLAQLVFGLTVAIAVVRSRAWVAGPIGSALDRGTPSLSLLAAVATAAIWLQILLGAVVRHTGAGLAIPTFPLAYGRLVPPLESLPVALHFAHRAGAVGIALLAAILVVRARRYANVPGIRSLAALLGFLVLAQIALGGWVILSYKSAWVTTAHLGLGALVFAASLVLALLSRRRLALSPAPAHPPIEPRLDTAVAS